MQHLGEQMPKQHIKCQAGQQADAHQSENSMFAASRVGRVVTVLGGVRFEKQGGEGRAESERVHD